MNATRSTKCEAHLYSATVPLWKPILFTAMAGGTGWGIRGQYGHENGAMIAGALVSDRVFSFCTKNAHRSLGSRRGTGHYRYGIRRLHDLW